MKTSTKMLKNIFAITLIICIFISGNTVRANTPIGGTGNKKIVSCPCYEEGELILLGNHCLSGGTQNCMENPCD